MTITLNTRLFDTEGTWETYLHDIIVDGQKVGYVSTMTDTENDDETYLEDITIDEEFRNQGIGTQTIKMVAEMYGYIYFAPCNEDNVRCYERFAEEEDSSKNRDIDQGYGIYFLEK